MLPTPNELAAPGLWLARIDLPAVTTRDRMTRSAAVAGARA